ncbi:DUF1800 domain-containing protein [Conexibacter woesei]|uniref:DUF1800 domain-containing protein n=1 Tax=Conexibacter woesei (strain DSM 14684 / CCUG 47730 / CIP 108061 / JCM 11494 / NBRC 100937 / ID131577) TaxID=469383 RepID=D3FCR1_CONWI|nr:DUF1800 domain-containing protein [Conexibacter woesei]ADB49534.1 Protein of unknown function DUF1800 [Conexibacter woesei DSM 14684]
MARRRRSAPGRTRRPVSNGGWTEAHVHRLFWRAGFGATAAEARTWARRGRAATLDFIVKGPPGGPRLIGPEPHDEGRRLDPVNEWGDDVLWWLDRMIRSNRPLVEKMTLFWHDHFATADQDTPLMLAQNRLFRRHALGAFRPLLREVTRDPAMQLWLSLADSTKDHPNENYARELMELFTLGGGYSERDVRQAARALTGFRSKWGDRGLEWIRYDADEHDRGVKRILGRSGRFDVDGVLDLVCDHPRHAPFLVTKLWEFFVATPPSGATVRALAATYRRAGLRVEPVVRQILDHPTLYRDLDAPDLVKWPVVYVAGAMRMTGSHVTHGYPVWMLSTMGQQLFRPPSVAGWDWGAKWMSSNAMRQRFAFANYVVAEGRPRVRRGAYKATLRPQRAVELAIAAVGSPPVSPRTRRVLTQLAATWFDDLPRSWRDDAGWRAESLQRALRHLLIAGPEAQLC